MKITIDTKEDSPEDIRKIVALLSSFVARSAEKPRNIFEDSSPGLDVFNQGSQVREEAKTTESDVGNAFTSLFGNSENPEPKIEEKEEKPEIEIIPY